METEPRLKKVPWESQLPNGQVLLSMPWELFVYGAAVLSIANIAMALVLHDDSVFQVVVLMDVIFALIFTIDLLRRLRVAQHNRAYLIHGQGWLDAISIFPALHIARLLRVVHTTRTLRSMGGVEPALKVYFANRATGGLLLVFFIAILVLEFGSMGVLAAEIGNPDANIVTADDAVWYTLVTMSTVGYGDQYPVTNLGRIFGTLNIIVGVGVFGTLTGFLANVFITPRQAEEAEPAETAAEEPAPPARVPSGTGVAAP
jgi:voltage-gated potassium channel